LLPASPTPNNNRNRRNSKAPGTTGRGTRMDELHVDAGQHGRQLLGLQAEQEQGKLVGIYLIILFIFVPQNIGLFCFLLCVYEEINFKKFFYEDN
jgi:hypothetical protein